MSRSGRTAALSLILCAPSLWGQTVSCAGVSAWSPTTTYAAGAQVTYAGGLYKALVPTTNVPPNYCASCGWWQSMGTCGTVATCTSAPAVPSGLSASGVTSTSLTLSWSAVSAPANCSVNYSVYKGGALVASGLTGTSAAITGLSAATTYAFTVSASDAAGASAQSAALSVKTSAAATCTSAPAVPTGLSASGVTSSSVNLSWKAVTAPTNCSVTYTVYRGGSTVASGLSGTSAAITGLSASTPYTFTVAAATSAGASAQSSAVSVTTSAGSDPACSGLVTWTSSGVYTQGHRVVYEGKIYEARWWTQNERPGSTGDWGVWKYIGDCTSQACSAAPSVPGGLKATGITSSSLNLAWNASTAGAGCTITYTVYQNGAVKVSGLTTPSAAISGLTASTTYAFTVAAVDTAGTSARSAALSATTLSSTSLAFTQHPSSQKVTTGSTATFVASARAGGAVSYQWKRNGAAISGATSFRYTTAVTTSADNGASYTVTASGDGASITSNAATLTVMTDIDDLMGRAGGRSYSSTTPMGSHFQGRHVTTDSDRLWLSNASNQPPIPSGHESDLHLKTFTVNLYPSGSPSPADINQHSLGDCNGITALAAMAYMVPDFVKGRITNSGGGVFTVAMFDPQGQPVNVAVDSQFLADGSGKLGAVSGKNDVATWSTVLEKAVMKYNAIYQCNSTIEGIGSEHVTPLFTGAGNSFSFDRGVLSAAEITRVIKASLACGKFISGGFGAQLTWNNVTSVTAHGYACFWPLNGSTMISMRNPWGVNPTTSGGYDGSLDGMLNLPATTAWAQTIDLRIIDSGIAGTAGRTTPYTAPATLMSLAPAPVRLSPRITGLAAQ